MGDEEWDRLCRLSNGLGCGGEGNGPNFRRERACKMVGRVTGSWGGPKSRGRSIGLRRGIIFFSNWNLD